MRSLSASTFTCVCVCVYASARDREGLEIKKMMNRGNRYVADVNACFIRSCVQLCVHSNSIFNVPNVQSLTSKSKSSSNAANGDAGNNSKSQSALPISMTDKMMEQHSGLLSGEFKQASGDNRA